MPLLLAALLAGSPTAAASTTFVVCAGTDCPEETTHSTIAAAYSDTSAGDVILVHPGEYSQALDLQRDLTIIGLEGSDETWINSSNSPAVHIRNGAEVTLQGFRVGAGSSRAIRIEDDDTVAVLEGILVREVSHSSRGGAIRIEDESDVTIRDSRFEDVHTSNSSGGGCLYIEDDAVVLVEHTVFEQCRASNDNGGVARLVNSAQLTLRFVSLRDSEADDHGGAISAESSSQVWIEDSLIERNEASNRGGALYLQNNAQVEVRRTDLLLNVAGDDGGAVHVRGSGRFEVHDSLLASNEARDGGAVYVRDSGRFEVHDSMLASNEARDGGAVFHIGGQPIELRGSELVGNTATSDGGAIYFRPSSDVLLTVAGSTLRQNVAGARGGGLFADNRGEVDLYENRFEANQAGTWGGAVRALGLDGLLAQGNVFCENTAGSGGAGATSWDFDEQVWVNNVFVENTTEGDGGGMDTNTEMWLVNNTFAGNAAGNGGALYTEDDLYFVNNIVAFTQDGHGIRRGGGSATYRYNLFYENLASHTSGLGTLHTSNLFDLDPLFVDYSPGDGCEADLRPLIDSPVIQAGHPDLFNPDGTRSDIGAYGGPFALDWWWEDADGDGWPWVYDCDDDDPNNWISCDTCVDEDGDGWYVDCDDYVTIEGPDCDDSDPTRHGYTTWWLDCDGDGYYGETAIVTCGPLSIDEFDPDLNPDVTWPCQDEGVPFEPVNATTFLDPDTYVFDCDDSDPFNWVSCETCADNDGDGWYAGCDAYDDELLPGPDCDDDDPFNWVSCETCADNDGDGWYAGCDSYDDELLPGPDCDDDDPNNWISCETCVDEDGDGWYVGCDAYDTIDGPDCDDTNPEAQELETWWVDCDGDGYFGDTAIVSCGAPTLATFDPDLNPGVPWPCIVDGAPANPIGEATTDLDPDTYHFDCDDNDIYTFPGAPELCNGKDNNCSGTADDDVVYQNWYPDNDGDGYGDASGDPVWDCDAPEGYVNNNEDCDDTNPNVWHSCDTCVDEDGDGWYVGCDAYVTIDGPDCDDDDPLATEITSWWLDCDGDGFYGETVITSCNPPTLANFDAELNPGVSWPCVDGDGTPVEPAGATTDLDPSTYVFDCDDADPTVYPGAPEYCNGIDNSCNGVPDHPDPVDGTAWWPDADGDGFGDMDAEPVVACEQPEGHVDNDLDCDDTDPNVYPGAPEAENDCDRMEDPDTDLPDDVAARGLRYGGGGCGCSGPALPPAGLLPLVLVVMTLRRRR